MRTYLLEIYRKEVTVDYDEAKSILIIDDNRRLKLSKIDAYIFDQFESEYQKDMGASAWNSLEFFLKALIKYQVKRI